jgi:actin-related protein
LTEQNNLNPADHPILIVEPLNATKDYKVKMVEILFEKFGFKGVFF